MAGFQSLTRGGDCMQVIGNGDVVVDMLKDFGLSEYEARMYFSLLTLGEAKVTAITRKASVPQSKAYDVLDRLIAKGFVKLSNAERPKQYQARALKEVAVKAIAREEKHIRRLYNTHEMLEGIIQTMAQAHNKFDTLRLFSPKYKRR
jgi:sugar-specific transcriptional regulator TrmB